MKRPRCDHFIRYRHGHWWVCFHCKKSLSPEQNAKVNETFVAMFDRPNGSRAT